MRTVWILILLAAASGRAEDPTIVIANSGDAWSFKNNRYLTTKDKNFNIEDKNGASWTCEIVFTDPQEPVLPQASVHEKACSYPKEPMPPGTRPFLVLRKADANSQEKPFLIPVIVSAGEVNHERLFYAEMFAPTALWLIVVFISFRKRKKLISTTNDLVGYVDSPIGPVKELTQQVTDALKENGSDTRAEDLKREGAEFAQIFERWLEAYRSLNNVVSGEAAEQYERLQAINSSIAEWNLNPDCARYQELRDKLDMIRNCAVKSMVRSTDLSDYRKNLDGLLKDAVRRAGLTLIDPTVEQAFNTDEHSEAGIVWTKSIFKKNKIAKTIVRGLKGNEVLERSEVHVYDVG